MNSTIKATYNGVKRTAGDQDNLPKTEHEFIIVIGTNNLPNDKVRFNDIKLLQKAGLEKGKEYEIILDELYQNVPVSIAYDGVTYKKESNNRIVCIHDDGKKENLSNNPTMTRLGQATRAFNLKLKAEGKEPIKPIKRRW